MAFTDKTKTGSITTILMITMTDVSDSLGRNRQRQSVSVNGGYKSTKSAHERVSVKVQIKQRDVFVSASELGLD